MAEAGGRTQRLNVQGERRAALSVSTEPGERWRMLSPEDFPGAKKCGRAAGVALVKGQNLDWGTNPNVCSSCRLAIE